jgi:two-component system C4-dicarboxylate transport response regulator DctD
MQIFVVDDDPSLRMFVKRWLAQLAGHDVRVFDNGAAAVEALTSHTPCLLLSDLDMPGLSGEEVAEAAAHLPRPPRIVLMSGDHDRLKRAQGLAQATLEKPFSFRALLSILDPTSCFEG